MATTIHPSISKKNPYYISKHRYYELKHFCLQYPEWKKEYEEITLTPKHYISERIQKNKGDPTSELAIRRTELENKMKLVEQTAIKVSPDLYQYLLLGVTKGLSYDALLSMYKIPCCREYYYVRYRYYFFQLSISRK